MVPYRAVFIFFPMSVVLQNLPGTLPGAIAEVLGATKPTKDKESTSTEIRVIHNLLTDSPLEDAFSHSPLTC